MTEQATQQATPAAAPTAAPTTATPAQPEQRSTVDERAHQLLESLRADDAEGRKARAFENGEPAPAAPATAPAEEAARSERRARLQALYDKERGAVDRKDQQAAVEKAQRAYEEERRQRAALEEQLARRIDPSSIDEAALFALAEQNGIRADRMVEWIRDSLTNPEKIATATALRETSKKLDPQIRALEERIAAAEQERQRERAAYQRQVAINNEQSAHMELLQLTKQSSDSAPFSARFLERQGPQEFYRVAAQAAEQVPAGAGLQAVLDLVEENLASLAPIYGAPQAPTPSNGTAPPHTRAAAQATTVSNSLAASRASVVEPRDLASMSLDERAQWAMRALERGDL